MTNLNLSQEETSEPKPRYSTAVKTGGTATDVTGRVLWIGVLLGAVLAIFNFVTTRMTASEISAPQLAALASECLAIAVLPYVLARLGMKYAVPHGGANQS